MTPIRIAIFTILSALFMALGASPASAACPPATVNPGNSEADQYQETIPGSCGDQASGGGPTDGSSSGGAGDGSVPAGTVEELQSLGADGAATAGLADATAQNVDDGNRNGSSNGGLGTPPGTPTGGSGAGGDGSPLSAVARALGGDSADGGLGVILPLILLGTLIAAVLAAVRRRMST